MKNTDKLFDKTLIKEIASPVDYAYANDALGYVYNALNDAINEINKRKHIITSFDIKIINEFINLANHQASDIDALLIIKSPQLELNSLKLNKNIFTKAKNLLKQVLKEIARIKPKKKKKVTDRQLLAAFNTKKEKYTLFDFKIELLKYLPDYFSSESTIEITKYGIKFNVKNQFGLDINLNMVFNLDGDKYKLFDTNIYKFNIIDYGNRIDNLKAINEKNKHFKTMLRIFNSAYFNIMNENFNQILLESIISSCPNEMYNDNDEYNNFLNTFNYMLINREFSKYYAITNNKKTIQEEKLISNEDLVNYSKFLNILSKSI